MSPEQLRRHGLVAGGCGGVVPGGVVVGGAGATVAAGARGVVGDAGSATGTNGGAESRPPFSFTNAPAREHTGPGGGSGTSGSGWSASLMKSRKIGADAVPPKPAP